MKFFSFVIIVALLLTSCHSKKKPVGNIPIEVTAFQVEPKTIPAQFQFVGVAKSSHPVEIRSRVEGYLLSIDYLEGGMVNVNDRLFKIDPRQFEASLQEAAGELAREEAILWRAQRNFDRLKPLYVKHATSQRDLDDARAQVLTGEAQVLVAKANVIQAELNLSYTDIISPIKGLASKAIYREGTLITPAINGLLTLVSVIDPIWVYFSVSDNELLQVHGEKTSNQLILPQMQEYTVTLLLADGSKFPHKGKVSFASPTLDPLTGSMNVRAVFSNPEGLLLPGQFVQAFVSGALRPNALFVPQQSVFQGKSGMYVFVIDVQNKVKLRSVEVGAWYKEFWVITQGLAQGELVVADGINKVQEGATVHVRSTSTPFNQKLGHP